MEDLKMPEVSDRERRVVLIHKSGLREILGYISGMPDLYYPKEANVEVDGEVSAIACVRMTDRMFVFQPVEEVAPDANQVEG